MFMADIFPVSVLVDRRTALRARTTPEEMSVLLAVEWLAMALAPALRDHMNHEGMAVEQAKMDGS